MKHFESVHIEYFPPSEWLINPDLSAVEGIPRKYWKLVGYGLEEMTPAEKAAVDAISCSPPCDCNTVNDSLGGPSVTGMPYH